ncbi:MAG: hypothetical protein CMJ48_13120 [Planctomycetaceae bacterium]|nr:hypothetical protein [Planctomycetaceae bacterium]
MPSTRRTFLTTALGSGAALSFSGSMPQFLLHAAEGEQGSNNETILVVVQLSGGNDGLNTIVPYDDDAYLSKRPKLGIPADKVLKIDKQLGFHPAAKGLADLLEDEKLAVIQGVGYEKPNRSHFESMDIWHTCRRKTERRTEGWLGRVLDASASDAGGDVPALHLGHDKQPLALAAKHVRTPSVRSLERFRLRSKENEKLIGSITATKREKPDALLDFVQTSTTAALSASRRVEKAAGAYKSSVEYPQSDLGQKLRTTAQLIDSGLKTRIYYVTLDGFDMHSQQAAAHTALLTKFSAGVSAFVKDLAEHGHEQRVLVTGFSEFGRRVQENASEGTDHGAAGPMFFAGGRVKPGLHGAHPSLTDLVDGDLKHHTDFREVYATVLERWLRTSDSASILGKEYEPVDFLKT